MRFAKTVTALALACSLALAIPTFAAPAAEEQAGRQEDLELLYQTIRDRHPGPFTNTPEQEFLARIAQIEARIDTEDSMSFGLDLQSLVALIGDSHTTTNLNSILSSGHMFPVSVKWMDGDWVLYQVDASHQGALGQQVTSVNGFSMDQVQEKMAPLISADNEIKLRRQLSQVFGHQEIMVYCGLLKPEEDLTLTLENGTSITLSPLSMQDQSGWPEINGLSQQRQGSAPTDYQKGTYYFSLPLDSRTYYIQYNQCMEDPELPMETFTAQAAQRGLTIVTQQAFTEGTKTDFSTQINAIRNSGCDLVFIPIYAAEASVFLTQAKGKLDGMTIFGCDGLDGLKALLEVDNKIADIEGEVSYMTPFDAEAQDEKTKNFVAAYKEAYKVTPDQFAADGYDAVYVLYEAMKKADVKDVKISASDLCEILKTTISADDFSFTGTTGGMTWDASGAPAKEPVIVKLS